MTAEPPTSVVVVGAGLAAACAAETLRAEGYDGPVTLIGDDPEPPYDRPPLSKDYLLGQVDIHGAGGLHDGDRHPPGWYAEHGVDLRTGQEVTALDTDGRRVRLAHGEELSFGALLLATGARARRLPGQVPGPPGRTGVHTLRTRADAVALREALAPGGSRVAVVGSGWIGLEVAAAARAYGNDVVVIGRDQVPLGRVLGREVGGVFATLHRENGVELRTGTEVCGLRHAEGAVRAVVLGDGTEVRADVVVVGIGAEPNDSLARECGLAVAERGGVAVDAGLCTSHPAVWAVGDVASVHHPLLDAPLRVEHWANAHDAGPVAARSILGQPVVSDLVPFFWTDQFDLGMEYSGFAHLAAGGELVVRGDLASRKFVAFWLVEDRVVAGMNVNVWDVTQHVEALVRSCRPIDRDRLRDPRTPLAELAG